MVGLKAWMAGAVTAVAMATAGGAGATVYYYTVPATVVGSGVGADGGFTSFAGEADFPTTTLKPGDEIFVDAQFLINVDGSDPFEGLDYEEEAVGFDHWIKYADGVIHYSSYGPSGTTITGMTNEIAFVGYRPETYTVSTVDFWATQVPEPGTWLMAIVGIGLLGSSLRRSMPAADRSYGRT